jgi:hypothetical protein
MDKKLSATLSLTPEWAKANEALKEDSTGIAIELRQFRMPEGQSITVAYKEINQEFLSQVSSTARNALLEVAKVLSRNTNNTWTYAFTRVEMGNEESAGLRLDQNRIKVIGLASKRGVQTLLKKVGESYEGELGMSRLCGFTGLGWGKPQQQFLLVTVPLEGRAQLNEMAEQAGFKLSETVPRDPITNKQTHRTRFIDYPTALFDEDNLLYLAYSSQEVVHAKPTSSDELRRA